MVVFQTAVRDNKYLICIHTRVHNYLYKWIQLKKDNLKLFGNSLIRLNFTCFLWIFLSCSKQQRKKSHRLLEEAFLFLPFFFFSCPLALRMYLSGCSSHCIFPTLTAFLTASRLEKLTLPKSNFVFSWTKVPSPCPDTVFWSIRTFLFSLESSGTIKRILHIVRDILLLFMLFAEAVLCSVWRNYCLSDTNV